MELELHLLVLWVNQEAATPFQHHLSSGQHLPSCVGVLEGHGPDVVDLVDAQGYNLGQHAMLDQGVPEVDAVCSLLCIGVN